MKIRISGLDNSTYTYDFEGNIDDIKLEEPFYDKYKTEVVLTKFDDQMILEASTISNARFTCDRCGIDYQGNVESKYKMVYLFRNVDEPKEETDITYLSPDTININITDDVRDYLILAVPMKKLCKEDCKGLCYKCGTDLNKSSCDCKQDEIDDRWSKLLELKNKFNTN
jgi:uncharacterized protein